MEWNDLDPKVREVASQMLARGFDDAAVRLLVRWSPCSLDDARSLLRRDRRHTTQQEARKGRKAT